MLRCKITGWKQQKQKISHCLDYLCFSMSTTTMTASTDTEKMKKSTMTVASPTLQDHKNHDEKMNREEASSLVEETTNRENENADGEDDDDSVTEDSKSEGVIINTTPQCSKKKVPTAVSTIWNNKHVIQSPLPLKISKKDYACFPSEGAYCVSKAAVNETLSPKGVTETFSEEEDDDHGVRTRSDEISKIGGHKEFEGLKNNNGHDGGQDNKKTGGVRDETNEDLRISRSLKNNSNWMDLFLKECQQDAVKFKRRGYKLPHIGSYKNYYCY